MSANAKSVLAVLVVLALSVALATFTQWGFDPREWSNIGRGAWAAVTLYIAGAAAMFARV